MALLETWDQGGRAPEVAALSEHDMEEELLRGHSTFVDDDEDDDFEPMFSVERVDYQPPSPIKHMVVCNGTNRIKAAESEHGGDSQSRDLEEITDIQRKATHGHKVYKMFMDPTGRHLIISLTSMENWYLHKDQLRPKMLDRFKGVLIESIAWDKSNDDPSTTSKMLIGTSKGRIRESCISRGGKDVTWNPVYNMSQELPITGLHYERFPSDSGKDPKYVVFATTTTRIYQFIGGPSFEAVFPSQETNARFIELPGDLSYSHLCFFSKYAGGLSQSFAWLTGPGVYYGDLVFGGQNPGDTLFQETTLLPFPELSSGMEDHEPAEIEAPLDMAVTEFHFLLLYRQKLVAIGRLDERVTAQEPLIVLTRKVGRILGMIMDPMTRKVWIYAQGCVYEVKIHDESREVWKLYLDRSQFESALQYCKTPQQRDQVLSAQADYHFSNGKYKLAATFYGKIQRSFEAVALKFVRRNEMGALRTYLLHKLDHISEKDTTQRILVSTWLVQLYLDSLNTETSKERFSQTMEELKQILKENCKTLDPKTTLDLLATHGRTDPLLFFAKITGENELLIQQFIEIQRSAPPPTTSNPFERYHTRTQYYQHAVDVLLGVHKSMDVKDEAEHLKFERLVYNFSPVLIERVPCELIKAWIQFKILQPRKLLPALVCYDISANLPDVEENQAILYLEHCIRRLKSKDRAIHNALLALYTKDEDEERLLRFIKQEDRYFELQFGLRQCLAEGKKRSSVLIYSQMNLFEEAVELALSVDIELACRVADMGEDDETLLKRLWLRIAKHVVEEKKDIHKAVEFLHRCRLLKIEDILPFFQDFVVIDSFQNEICLALEEYNRHIDELKNEMKAAEVSSELIRRDTRNLRQKYGYVSDTHECDLCTTTLMNRAFYMFPCEHTFHSDCFKHAIRPHMDRITVRQLDDLEKQLSQEVTKQQMQESNKIKVKEEEESTFTSMVSKVLETIESDSDHEEAESDPTEIRNAEIPLADQINEEIDRFVARECLYCGDIMVNSIDKPFIDETEQAEAEAWALFE